MPCLLYICFLGCFTFPTYSKVIFSDVLNAALLEIRSKREAPCREDIDLAGGSGTIQLRTEDFNGTQFYRADEDCTWRLKTLPDHNMIITSEYFRIENSDDCLWDYVEIREQNGFNSRYCGRNPFIYITDGDEIVIQFKSDVSYEDRGFKLHIESKTADNDASRCNTSIVGGKDSKIFNNVAVGAGCFYRIQAPADKVIQLDLKTLQFDAEPCEEESLLIFQGLTNQRDSLLTLCSDALKGPIPLQLNSMFIEYRNPLGQERERFVIEYKFVDDTFTPPPTPPTTPSPVGGNNDCSGFYKDINMLNREMIYTAPEYQDNKECVIVVRNTLFPLQVVQIHFVYFRIEDSDDCKFDSLRIFSGERNDSLPLGGPYCGKSLNDRTFISNGNSIRLEFKTDESYALKGFQANITFVKSRDCQCPANKKCIRQGFEKICIRATTCPINTCKNGGTCVNNGTHETCYCTSGYRGIDCSESDISSAYDLHFTKAPQDRSLRRFQGITEECKAETQTNEPIEYQWTFNGAPLAEFDGDFGTHPGGVLQINRFRHELAGEYSCIAKTSLGRAEHTFDYRLVSVCGFQFDRGPAPEQKKVNSNVILYCIVRPESTKVRWKKDGMDIDNWPRFSRKGQFGLLQIENLTMGDEGVYSCEAEDQDGCSSSTEAKLTVINVKPFNKYCGLSIHDKVTLSKITGGDVAAPKENPWHVTLRSLVGAKVTFCGGTLITQTYVLTAAHCISEFPKKFNQLLFNRDNVRMIFGTVDCSGVDPAGTFRGPKHVHIHPDYNNVTFDSDIALIELDSPIEYTDSIRPICLEPASYNDKVFLEDRRNLGPAFGRVAGCGNLKSRDSNSLAEKLQQVHLPYVPREKCEESYGNTHTVTKNMICAGFNNTRSGNTCQGDSGGGLIMTHDAKWIQTGIVSHGRGKCDDTKYYGIYTNVGIFYEWIGSIAKFTQEEVHDFPDWSLKR